MTTNDYIIREIRPSDNLQIAQIIKNIYQELNITKEGTTLEDNHLNKLYEFFDTPYSVYFVVAKGKKVFGGAGISQLQKSNKNICELQKMYLTPSCRKKGIGKKLIKLCLQRAKELNYKQCYLETHAAMKEAQQLYKKFNFKLSPTPLGKTGHFNCQTWMIKTLS